MNRVPDGKYAFRAAVLPNCPSPPPALPPPMLPPSAPPSWYELTAQRPNIMYLVAHDFRADFGQMVGEALPGSVVFNLAFTQVPICSPSRLSFFTGRHPTQTQYYGFSRSERRRLAPLNRATPQSPMEWTGIAQAFARGGYATWGTGETWCNPHFAATDCSECWTSGYHLFPDYNMSWSYASMNGIVDAGYGRRLSDWLSGTARPRDRPFFAMAGYWGGHSPYTTDGAVHRQYHVHDYHFRASDVQNYGPPAHTGPHTRKNYAHGKINGTWQADRQGYLVKQGAWLSQFQRLVRLLESLGLSNSTIVLFHADHGLSIGEYGVFEKAKLFGVPPAPQKSRRVHGIRGPRAARVGCLVCCSCGVSVWGICVGYLPCGVSACRSALCGRRPKPRR